jgi:hypothetical protein
MVSNFDKIIAIGGVAGPSSKIKFSSTVSGLPASCNCGGSRSFSISRT